MMSFLDFQLLFHDLCIAVLSLCIWKLLTFILKKKQKLLKMIITLIITLILSMSSVFFYRELMADARRLQAIFTFIAVLVAIFGPWIANRWKRRFEKTNLIILRKNYVQVNQDNPQPNVYKSVGRLIIENDSSSCARSVGAYAEEIKIDGTLQADFLPVPLIWTHCGENTIININGHQRLHLDIFYLNNTNLELATPIKVDKYKNLRLGKIEIKIKLFQENGQIFEYTISFEWDGVNIPEFNKQ